MVVCVPMVHDVAGEGLGDPSLGTFSSIKLLTLMKLVVIQFTRPPFPIQTSFVRPFAPCLIHGVGLGDSVLLFHNGSSVCERNAEGEIQGAKRNIQVRAYQLMIKFETLSCDHVCFPVDQRKCFG